MTKQAKQSGRRIAAAAVLAGTVLLAAVAAIYPNWQAFVEADYAQTCYDARYFTGIRYQQEIRSRVAEGFSEDELDYEQILRDVIQANYTFTLEEGLVSRDLCRGGGLCTFVIDETTHSLSIECDQEGHEWYDDTGVDDALMDYVDW